MARNICREVGEGPLIGLCVLKGGYQFFGDLMNSIKSISSSGGKQINKQTKTLNMSAANHTIDTAQANDFENSKLC